MYKYGKRLGGWTEREGEFTELCERRSFTASLTVLDITGIHLLHSAKHLQVD